MLVCILLLSSAWADRSVRANEDEVLPPGVNASPVPRASVLPLKKTSRRSGDPALKEADGSAAPNRFEAETVIKSSYTLDGKPLEVDPD
jgi:hypothetical protein